MKEFDFDKVQAELNEFVNKLEKNKEEMNQNFDETEKRYVNMANKKDKEFHSAKTEYEMLNAHFGRMLHMEGELTTIRIHTLNENVYDLQILITKMLAGFLKLGDEINKVKDSSSTIEDEFSEFRDIFHSINKKAEDKAKQIEDEEKKLDKLRDGMYG